MFDPVTLTLAEEFSGKVDFEQLLVFPFVTLFFSPFLRPKLELITLNLPDGRESLITSDNKPRFKF